jgi:cytosine/adenosine deaminase-related metal-dependent hydrolase
MCERSPKAEVRNPKETRSAKVEKKGAGKAIRSGGFRPSFGLRDSDLGLLLRARIVLPLSGPMIENGAVRIRGNRIAALGRWGDLARNAGRRVMDLGEVVLLPGLVNAHCHLDYTHMAGEFPPPEVFIDWLKLITSTKAGWSLSDYQQSWASGAQMLVRTGTTTVADVEAVPELLPGMWEATPLRVFSFLEMIGFTGRRTPQEILGEAVRKIRSLASGRRSERQRCCAGLSPHAPYTVAPELLGLSAETARRRGWPLAIHAGESAQEFEMFTRGRGQMFDWLKQSGRDTTDCGRGSPVKHLERCRALNQRLLLIHANYLGWGDAALLGRRRVSVVHCPRSHSYFQHQPFPLRRLLGAGVNICLGTDSLATVHKRRRQLVELNLFEELRTLAARESWLSAKAILQMATRNGARALGMGGRLGEISKGAFADLIAVPVSGSAKGIYEEVLEHRGNVAANMIDGRWAVGPEGAQAELGLEIGKEN